MMSPINDRRLLLLERGILLLLAVAIQAVCFCSNSLPQYGYAFAAGLQLALAAILGFAAFSVYQICKKKNPLYLCGLLESAGMILTITHLVRFMTYFTGDLAQFHQFFTLPYFALFGASLVVWGMISKKKALAV